MKTTLTQHEAVDMLMKFEAFGTCEDAYSLCYSMAEYLEEYEESTGVEIELDPVAIRCGYSVIELRDVCEDYTLDSGEDPLEYLQHNTIVIPTELEDTYIIQEF